MPSDDTDVGDAPSNSEVAEFYSLVSFSPEDPWEKNAPLKLYAQACAENYIPQGQSLEAWSKTATVDDFFRQVYAMQILPAELRKTTENTDGKRMKLWEESAQQKFLNECETAVLPLVCKAIEEDAQEWHMPIPSTREHASQEYKDFMEKAAKRKAYEIYGYLSEVEEAMFEFRSEDVPSRVEELFETDRGVKKLDHLINTEETFGIAWYERPLRMNDAQWVVEKKRIFDKTRKEEQDKEDNKTEEEKVQESLEKEDNERETARAHELKRLGSEVVGPRTTIDSTARRLYSDALIILSYWWDHGPLEDDEAKLAALNHRVKAAVSQDGYVALAPTHLKQLIQDVRKHLDDVKHANDTDKDPRRLELAKAVVHLSNVLRAHGFDWKSVANRRIQREVLLCLYKSEQEGVRKRRESLIQSIFEPYPEQYEFIEKFSVMLTVVSSALQYRNQDTLRVVVESLIRINEEDAQKINTSLGLKREDHYFPVEHLEKIVAANFDNATTKSQLNALIVKMKLLSIPGTDVLASNSGSNPDPSSDDIQTWEKELLGLISHKKETPNVQASYPSLHALLAEPLYDCKDKKTVGWGDHNGRFYINQYGPDTAPIWRKESDPIPGYRDNDYEDGLPPHQQVTNGDNRIGNTMVSGSKTKRMYTLEGHIMDVLGVAFAEDPTKDTYASLTEKTINGTRRDSVYVLILWDRYLTRADPELRWEPASELRLRLGTKRADERIKRTAQANQKRFEEECGACRISMPPSSSSASTQPPQFPPPASGQQPRSPSQTRTRSGRALSVMSSRGEIPSSVGTPHAGSKRVQELRGVSDTEALWAENQEMKEQLKKIQQHMEGMNLSTRSR
ncbi:hypothetical protein BU23DRAFT_633136 [Bimuria novae-zelandiae CBS 107.79]|uniref:Uncharacterized protein n=1 Tax=Bimuria novae-zelandiae CBS 107.79 TaxID=1447943 RepID=A0A6A5UKB0_9PLEO|nr:hypothetical protein BU23DRAFT_633136 [Bimuria novae-zelandiae CBS 107.79]